MPPAPRVSRPVLFRLLAVVLAPLIFVGGLELALRLIGYGYPTGFFRTISVDGKKLAVENDQFSWRFFPRHLARRPLPVSFATAKPEGTYRIFVMGESAAMGDPEPAFGLSRILEALLRERFPQTGFEVINVAFTAINSHVILPIARDCARQQGDLWIIYMGHNEVQGPLGPGTIFGAHRSRLWLLRAALAVKTTRIGQLIEDLQSRWKPEASPQKTWRGLEMFLGHQFRCGDPRLTSMAAQFQENLQDIIAAARRSRAAVILCTPASNLKDSAPFASLHAPGFNPERHAAWRACYEPAVTAEAAGQPEEAWRLFQKCAAVDPDFAVLHFRAGRCSLALGRQEEARNRFELARDLDTLRFRADSRLNNIIQETAATWKSRGVYFCDTRQALARATADGIPGEESFFDHVHLKFAGNYLLAREMAEQVRQRLPAPLRKADAGSWVDTDRCAWRLGLTSWAEYQMHEVMQRRLLEAPFTSQLNHAVRQEHYRQKLGELRRALEPEAMQTAAARCREALSVSPQDPYLHEILGRTLAAAGDAEGAVAAFQKVIAIWPHHATAYSNVGLLLYKLGRDKEAEQFFRRALERRPDLADAHNGLGVIHAGRGNLNAAILSYRRALAAHPEFMEAQVNLGNALKQQGNLADAEGCYLEALRMRPGDLTARLALADLLLRQGQVFDAIPHLTEAAKSQPEQALAHARGGIQSHPDDPNEFLKLASILATLNQPAEAQRHLETAVRLQTNFWQARYLLGVELAAQGRLPEAQDQFAAVVRLRPDFARGHLNLGVAFARQQRFAEAVAQFREVLRLESTNQLALQYLQTIRSLTNTAPQRVP